MSAAIWSEPDDSHNPHGDLDRAISIDLEDLFCPAPPPPPSHDGRLGMMDMRVYGVTDTGLRYELPLSPAPDWRPGMCPVPGCDCGGAR